LLALAAWGEPDAVAFPWFEAPPSDALAAARRLLVQLGLLDAGGALTARGRDAARLGTHPRLATLLLVGRSLGVADAACEAVALLEARAPMRRVGPPRAPSPSDLDDQRAALRGASEGWAPRHPGVAAEVAQAADRHRRRLRAVVGPAHGAQTGALALALAAAWPDRVAARREPGSDRFRLANGRGARLSRDSAVVQADVIVALDVSDGDDAHAQIHLAAALDPAALPTTRVQTARWDVVSDRVLTAEEVRFGDLVLERRLGAPVPASVVQAALVTACREDPRRFVPLADEAFAAWVARVRFAARRHPDEGWPDVSLEGLAGLAEGLAAGCRSLAALKGADWAGALRDALGWSLTQRLDVVAPAHLPVGVGRRAPLHYPLEGPPELSVRMQDLFGVRETPRVDGEPVALHLLAPNGRPVQVTRDLLGFWSRTWPEVRKELRARYPKHSWPEDPLAASPPAPKGRPPV
jgi:ATP-dependent helicase HrpB